MRVGFWTIVVALALVGCKRDKDDDGSKNKADCEKKDGTIHPGADELCNGVDDDCDGAVDEDAVDAPVWYADLDGDGFAGDVITQAACEQPEGFSEEVTDCNEIDAKAFPGAEERCNGADDDCDLEVDEEAVDAVGWFPDADEDGWGDETVEPVMACERPDDTLVSSVGDCDDVISWTHPFADEICDEYDNDCDGETDEYAVDMLTLYADGDQDGHGDPEGAVTACLFGSDFVDSDDDCDDDDDTAYPGADEICDDVDNDCDGDVDDDAWDAPTWHADVDGDGFGGSTFTTVACDAPGGFIADSTDCDDFDPDTFPGATELCGGGDNDCAGDGDDGAADASEWHVDADLDGFGSPTVSTVACSAPSGLVDNGNDCDDATDMTYPFATEVCDGADNDCDGELDEDVLGDAAICAGETCAAISDARYRPPSGAYWIDPEGDGTAIEVECDMATDGGGWTVIDGALLQSEGWLSFTRSGGTAPYSAAWYDRDGFLIDPNDGGSNCNGVAVQAVATLPFAFTAWRGEWTAMGGSATSSADDDATTGWGSAASDCRGHVLFGTDADDEKTGGEWGANWGSASPYEVWSWGTRTVTSTSTIRWEISDDGPDEGVLVTDIEIKVR
jgi:hypothetical protein